MAIVFSCILPHPPILVPEVGRGHEREAEPTLNAFRQVAAMMADHRPETIVIVSPHQPAYRDLFAVNPASVFEESLADFGVPSIVIEADFDQELGDAIIAAGTRAELPVGYAEVDSRRVDHGSWVPLYFAARAGLSSGAGLQGGRERLKLTPRIVILSISGLSAADHVLYGRAIAEAVRQVGRSVVLIASADLSHKLKKDGPYGFSPDGPIFESRFDEVIDSQDLSGFLEIPDSLAERAAVCGLQSSQILAGALTGSDYEVERLSHEGPFGVGYAVVAVRIFVQ
jgi:aromatic ring-opening dioxygenase LigB subunit